MRDHAEPHSLAGLLTTLAPLVFLPYGHYFTGSAPPSWFGWGPPSGTGLALAFLASATMLVGGLLLPSTARSGRALGSVGIVTAALVTVLAGPEQPLRGFVVLLTACLLLTRVWPPERVAPTPIDETAARAAARTSALTALAGWTIAVPGEWGLTSLDAVAAGLAALLATGRGLSWGYRHAREHRRAVAALTAASVVGSLGAVVAALLGMPLLALTCLALGPTVTLTSTRAVAPPEVTELEHAASLWQAIIDHPARFLTVTFAALAVLGGVLLNLPVAAADREIALLDALFTSVSAVCVTGLAVLDTPVAFSPVGELFLLALIQLGGLGIMTVSTATIGLLGRRMRLRHEGAMADLLGTEGRGSLYRLLRLVLGVTLACEASGALVLALLLVGRGVPVGEALWKGVFTAVSAFCNAGFALWSDSLVGFQDDPLVLHVVGALIVLGGLGGVPIVGIYELFRRRQASLQTRLVLSSTAILLVVGAIAILGFEWNGALAHLPWADRVHNAWFHSVTLRTAGFNALDMTTFQPASVTLMLLLMFIGGGPASTAGGVKVTTLTLLLLAVVAAVRGRSEASAFHRSIPHAAVYRAAAVVTVGLLTAAAALVALQVTQRMPSGMAAFEVISALGTVGLTIGGTARLDDVGKVIVMVCMFIGRVGPLTLFLILGERRARQDIRLPYEGVATG